MRARPIRVPCRAAARVPTRRMRGRVRVTPAIRAQRVRSISTVSLPLSFRLKTRKCDHSCLSMCYAVWQSASHRRVAMAVSALTN